MYKKNRPTVKDFFDNKLNHLKFDKDLITDLKAFRLKWSTKSDDYLDFLADNLLGTHTVRFSSIDDDLLMITTLQIENYVELQEELYTIPEFKRNFKVATNVIYQTLTYIAHKFIKNHELSKSDKEAGVRECCLILQYKMFSSLYSARFYFLTTPELATTAYNNLSKKHLIKKYKSWQAVFEFRVTTCLEKNSVVYPRLRSYSNDDTIRMITDTQTKLRSQFKTYYNELKMVKEGGNVVKQQSSTFEGEDGATVREVISNNAEKISYMKNIAQTPDNLIDKTSIDITLSIVNNAQKGRFLEFLRCMCNDKFMSKRKLDDIIDDILTISYAYLQRNGLDLNAPELLAKNISMIRYYWSNSKVVDPTYRSVKSKLHKAYNRCGSKASVWITSTIALAYIIYIFIKSIRKN